MRHDLLMVWPWLVPRMVADDSHAEFYSDTACATLVAVDGILYGPADVPAGSGANPRTTFTPVSCEAVGSPTGDR